MRVLDYFAKRERGNSVTVDRLLEALDGADGRRPRRKDVISVLREVAELGFGRFKTGRRGGVSRLEFSMPIAAVGAWARGDQVSGIETEEKLPATTAEILNHAYRLRPDYVIEVALPADLSAVEASRLAEFVKTLPFEQ